MSEQHMLGSHALRNKPVIVSFTTRESSQASSLCYAAPVPIIVAPRIAEFTDDE